MSTPAAPSAGRATFVLVLVTLLWGLSFSLMKNWQQAAAQAPGGEAVASLTLIAFRMTLALPVMALWQPRLFVATRRERLGGAAVGIAFFTGFFLQVWGLAYTTPALSAFYTSVGCFWVPLMEWAVFGTRVSGLILLGMVVGVAGMGVLVEGGLALGPGEWLTLAATVPFAAQVVLLDRFGRRCDPARLTPTFFGTAGMVAWAGVAVVAAAGPGLGAWASWAGAMLSDPLVVRDLVLMTLLPTLLAFHWMNTYQPRVPASRAALIYLLEPVFTAAISVWAYRHEEFTSRLVIGGGIILAGNFLAEVPRLLRRP